MEGLHLDSNDIVNLKSLAGLKQLKRLYLLNNPNLIKAEIDMIKKALPRDCKIRHNAKK